MSTQENEKLHVMDEQAAFAKIQSQGFRPVASINYCPSARLVIFGLAEIPSAVQASILTTFRCEWVGTLLLHMRTLDLAALWGEKWYGRRNEIVSLLDVDLKLVDPDKLNFVIQ